MAAIRRSVENQDEAELIDAIGRAQKLKLDAHPKPYVRETVEAAQAALSRIQRCKEALTLGIRALDASDLIDALAMAAGIGYQHPLVEEAKRVLATVQVHIARL
jgi:hypothetical protein